MSNQQELQHHGILGMKWGVRRYQNPDGSLTAAGKSRKKIKAMEARADAKAKKIKEEGKIKVAEAKAKAKAQAKVDKEQDKIDTELKKINAKSSAAKEKPVSEMTNAEIRSKIERIRLENELKSLTPAQKSAGQKFVETVGDKILTPAAIEGSKQALTAVVKDVVAGGIAKLTGTDKKTVKEAGKAIGEVTKDAISDAKPGKGKSGKDKPNNNGDNSGPKPDKGKAAKNKPDNNGDNSGSKPNNSNNTSSKSNNGGNKNTTNQPNSSSKKNDYDDYIDLNDYTDYIVGPAKDVPVNSPSLNRSKQLGQSYVAGLLGDGTRDDDD